jgi:Raf kinase inhibitor-like YbhB/YbcL family protein
MQEIPVKYTGEGEDVSPELLIEDIPEDTKSLAIIVDDPDSSGKIWVHWVVWGISVNDNPHIKTESEEHLPKEITEYTVTNVKNFSNIQIHENTKLGIVGTNDFNKIEYNGPIPPRGSGIHNYFFKVYALDNLPELRRGATREELEHAMNNHVIEKAELIGTYERT